MTSVINNFLRIYCETINVFSIIMYSRIIDQLGVVPTCDYCRILEL